MDHIGTELSLTFLIMYCLINLTHREIWSSEKRYPLFICLKFRFYKALWR